MNINFNHSINNFPLKSTDKDISRNNYMQNNLTQPSFCGTAERVERFAKSFSSKDSVKRILVSPSFNKFLKSALENPCMFEALVALLITCTARPLTITFTPGAKQEDKQYASAQSIASGLTGVGFTYTLFDPIKKGLDNIVVSINKDNVKNTFVEFYNNPKNKDLIDRLTKAQIIPSLEDFNKELAKGKSSDIFGYMKKYLKDNNCRDKISKILMSDDTQAQKQWAELSTAYSKELKEIFSKNRFNGVNKKHHFLVHDSLEFMNNGLYKLKTSAGADKTKYIINFAGKIILFPLTAGVMIWSIPKIMRVLFPNHRKSKGKNKVTVDKKTPKSMNSSNVKSMDTTVMSDTMNKSKIYEKFKNGPATSKKQVSFSGLGSFAQGAYEKCYSKPLSGLFEKLFRKITLSDGYSRKINNLLQTASSKKYKWEVPLRNESGKILTKADASPIISNLPNIAAIFGSCLYITNTIRNKEIEPERKPALCTNMALVAIFSLFASKSIENLIKPIFNNLKKVHDSSIGSKLNYDNNAAWDCASKMFISTFAFRYLGPVLATPAADKLVKLFNKEKASAQKNS